MKMYSGDNEDVLSYLNYSVVFLISFPAYKMQTFILVFALLFKIKLFGNYLDGIYFLAFEDTAFLISCNSLF